MFQLDSTDYANPALAIAFLDLAEQVARAEKRHNIHALDIRGGDIVIDIGCGTGWQSAELAKLAGPDGRVIGIDKSHSLIREARSRHYSGNLTFQEADVYSLPFDDETFDKGHIQRVLHYLKAPKAAMREAVRVLRRGTGRLMAHEPDWSSLSIEGGDQKATLDILKTLDRDAHSPENVGRRFDVDFAESGLVIEHCETRHFRVSDFGICNKLFGLSGLVERAVRDGYIQTSAVTPWFRSLIGSSNAGTLICSISGKTVVGRKAICLRNSNAISRTQTICESADKPAAKNCKFRALRYVVASIRSKPLCVLSSVTFESAVVSRRRGTLYLTRYDDVALFLSDPRFGKDFIGRMTRRHGLGITEEPIYADAGRWMLEMDPPAHSRVQAVILRAFSGSAMLQLRLEVANVVDALLDGAKTSPELDLVKDFARLVPITVMCNFLGIPQQDRDLFLRILEFDPKILERSLHPRDELDRANANCLLRAAYLGDLLDTRTRNPKEDLVSFLAMEQESGFIERSEAISLLNMLFVAGTETTDRAIRNGIFTLLSHRDQYEALRYDERLMRGAFDECLRYESPVQMVGRTALEDVEIKGFLVERGTNIIGIIGAANRDPEIFESPDVFDIKRVNAKKHLRFSRGVHSCIGQTLGRLQFEHGLSELFRRFPKIRISDSTVPQWTGNFIFRTLDAIPVTLNI